MLTFVRCAAFFYSSLYYPTQTSFSHVHPAFCFSLCVCSDAQLCPTLCDSMDCSPPGSSVHEILQARILVWVAISFSRGSSQPRDCTHISCISGIGRQILYPQCHVGSPFLFPLCVLNLSHQPLIISLFDILHILFQLVSGKGHIFFSSFRLFESIRNIFLCFELVLSMEIVSYLSIYLCHIMMFIFYYFVMTSRGGDFRVFQNTFSSMLCLFHMGRLSLCSRAHLPHHRFSSAGELEASTPQGEFLCVTAFLLGEFAFISFWFTSISICQIDCPLLPTGPCHSPPPSRMRRGGIYMYIALELSVPAIESVSGHES